MSTMDEVGRTMTLATLIVVTHHRLPLVASGGVGVARISRHLGVVESSGDGTERWLRDKATEAAGSTKRKLMLKTATRREADAVVSLQELTVEGARPDELVEMQKKAVPLSKSVGFPRYCQNGQVGW